MPLEPSEKRLALIKFLKNNPTNTTSIWSDDTKIIPKRVIDRLRKEQEKNNITIIEPNSVIGDYANNANTAIACYGSATTSGWGSFPSSDTASFGGSGTEGAIPN